MTKARGAGGSLWRAYWWELRKLAVQWRTYLGLAAVTLAPIAFVVAYQINPPSNSGGGDLALSQAVTQSGFALPLVVLFYTSLTLQPLVVALVAGDIFAAEDQQRTLKMILTRSTSRSRIFGAKALAALTYALGSLAVFAAAGLIGGGLAYGFGSVRLPNLALSPGQAALRVAAAFGVYALPLLVVACVGLLLSVLAKNSAGAIVGTIIFSFVVQFLRFLPGVPDWLETWLLTKEFSAWQGLFTAPVDRGALLHAAIVSIIYAGVPLVVAWRVFLRRDVIG